MTNKKKIILTILSCLFIAIACIFGFTIANKQDLNVKADSVTVDYVFYGSGIFTPVTPKSNNTPQSGFLNVAYSAYFIPSVIKQSTSGNVLINYSYIFSNVNGVNPPSTFNSSYTSSYEVARDSDFHTCVLNLPGTSRWLEFIVICSSDFNFNINKITLKYDSSYAGNTSLYCTIISFGAEVGYMDVLIPYYNVGNPSYAYLNRTYYLGSSFSDNDYYNAGVSYGKDVGEDIGFDKGYAKAIEENKSDWEQTGYNRGIRDANDYTFLGLIGATIDAPITALFGRLDTNPESSTYNQYVGGFFNFELLGVNLRSFFFAILTFALIIVIVRFALAR